MNINRAMIAFAAITATACSQQREANDVGNNSATVSPAVQDREPASAPQINAVEAPGPARRLPNSSLAEPKGPIDPKSVEAAGQVVQLYGAYLESGRLTEAAKLWSDPQSASVFAKQFRGTTHVEIGDLGPAEGAAGSIYTTIPAIFTDGGMRRSAEIVLRRVNDVPGSTEAQRRWHIERIDWKSGN